MELFLHRNHDLDDIQAVQAQIRGKLGIETNLGAWRRVSIGVAIGWESTNFFLVDAIKRTKDAKDTLLDRRPRQGSRTTVFAELKDGVCRGLGCQASLKTRCRSAAIGAEGSDGTGKGSHLIFGWKEASTGNC